MVSMNNLTIRSATAADTAALATLAALDSRSVPPPRSSSPTDGDQLIAAVSTHDGSAIADPFVRSADAVEMLRRRARQLDVEAPAQPPRLRPAHGHALRPCREHSRESAGVARLDPASRPPMAG